MGGTNLTRKQSKGKAQVKEVLIAASNEKLFSTIRPLHQVPIGNQKKTQIPLEKTTMGPRSILKDITNAQAQNVNKSHNTEAGPNNSTAHDENGMSVNNNTAIVGSGCGFAAPQPGRPPDKGGDSEPSALDKQSAKGGRFFMGQRAQRCKWMNGWRLRLGVQMLLPCRLQVLYEVGDRLWDQFIFSVLHEFGSH